MAVAVHLVVKIERDVAQLLLDVAHDLALGRGSERVAELGEDLNEILGEVAPGKVDAHDLVGHA